MDLDRLTSRMEEMSQIFAETRATLAEAEFTGTSDDERITATVDATGHLIDLEINPRALRRPDARGLANAVLLAAERARERAADASTDLLKNALGPGADARGLQRGDHLTDMIRRVGRHLSDGDAPPANRSEDRADG